MLVLLVLKGYKADLLINTLKVVLFNPEKRPLWLLYYYIQYLEYYYSCINVNAVFYSCSLLLFCIIYCYLDH